MDDVQLVEFMSDGEVLSTFGAAGADGDSTVDSAIYAQVMATELVRARNRVNLYRTLYASFLEAGKPFMVENLDDEPDGEIDGIPVKLVFSDDPDHVRGLEEAGNVNVWSEPELLEALTQERAVQQYFTDLLQELELAM